MASSPTVPSFDPAPTPARSACPCCGAGPMTVVYEQEGIPAQSCLLMADRASALAHPLGDMSLGFCPHCGFASNQAFNIELLDYGAAYEETQGFSPTFSAFARRLASEWIERYDVRDKDVIEIGCGKGEFLRLLCELGANRGVGFDPAYSPVRGEEPSRGSVTFIQDFYSMHFAHMKADFICCRHTLEHIGPAGEFVRMLRRSIGGRLDTVVCFEAPDLTRILRETAFWDIYYEHCSYFTLGSLARLFRACDFEVLDLRKVYDDQYLVIEAKPRGKDAPRAVDSREDLSAEREDIESFARNCAANVAKWKSDIAGWKVADKTIALWGSGSKAVGFLTAIKADGEIECVVDINPYKQGKFMPGRPEEIVAPQVLRDCKPDVVIVMNPIYLAEIEKDLSEMGLRPQLVAL